MKFGGIRQEDTLTREVETESELRLKKDEKNFHDTH